MHVSIDVSFSKFLFKSFADVFLTRTTKKREVSFAKRLEFDNEPIDKSLMKTKNNNGPRTESSGTNSSNKFLIVNHIVKRVRIRSYSGPYFLAFGLKTERYRVSLRIQSKCGKIRTRTTPNTDTFYAVNIFNSVMIFSFF